MNCITLKERDVNETRPPFHTDIHNYTYNFKYFIYFYIVENFKLFIIIKNKY
jgi:hypothetical protein